MSNNYDMEFEVSDTFVVEKNYAWVKRERRKINSGTSRRSLVRQIKAFAGFTGMRSRVVDYGDSIEIRPYGICQVAFAKVINRKF